MADGIFAEKFDAHYDLAGKVALVPGGASGIGVETCRLLAANGASVAVVDVNRTGGEKTTRVFAIACGQAENV